MGTGKRRIEGRVERPPTRPKSVTQAELKARFLEHFAKTAHVTRSAEYAGVSTKTTWDWRQEDPEFAKAYEVAHTQGWEVLEEEMKRRAFEGYDKRLNYRDGELESVVREYSDTLAMFLAKGNRPGKFVERSIVTTNDGGPGGRYNTLNDAELDALIAQAEKEPTK